MKVEVTPEMIAAFQKEHARVWDSRAKLEEGLDRELPLNLALKRMVRRAEVTGLPFKRTRGTSRGDFRARLASALEDSPQRAELSFICALEGKRRKKRPMHWN